MESSDDDLDDVVTPFTHTISPRTSEDGGEDEAETEIFNAIPPTAEDVDPGASTSRMAIPLFTEGIMEQSPPKQQDSEESDEDEVFHEPSLHTPKVRRSRTVSFDDEARTNAGDPSNTRPHLVVPPNTPQSVRNLGTSSGTPYFDARSTPKPLNPATKRKGKSASNIPKPPTRRIFQTTSASEASTGQPPPKPTPSKLAGSTSTKMARELKMLATYNKRGKSEDAEEVLPPKRKRKAKQFD